MTARTEIRRAIKAGRSAEYVALLRQILGERLRQKREPRP
jgi:hypothetical protein